MENKSNKYDEERLPFYVEILFVFKYILPVMLLTGIGYQLTRIIKILETLAY